MINILKSNNYNHITTRFINAKYNNISIIEYIDSFIESALPIILAFNCHVIIVIGHMYNKNCKHYVIADDSSYHIKNTFKQKEANVAIISEDDLKKHFYDDTVFTIAVTFDKFYFHYQYLKLIVDYHKQQSKNEFLNLKQTNNKELITNINILSRELLLESCEIKKFLYKCGDCTYNDVMMPHYVWYIEFYINEIKNNNLSQYMIIDASSHKYDKKYNIIKNIHGQSICFANTSMSNKQQLSKLHKI